MLYGGDTHAELAEPKKQSPSEKLGSAASSDSEYETQAGALANRLATSSKLACELISASEAG